MKNFWRALVATLVFTVVCGLVYPLVITGIANLFFPDQANGSLIKKNGEVIGSKLIGQEFTDPKFFHGRPSSSGYQSGTNSNIALSNDVFVQNVTKEIEEIRTSSEVLPETQVPSDLVLESASGLDPDISVDSAMIQVPVIARTRNVDPKIIEDLVISKIKQGIGWQYVNVLEMNLALEELSNAR